MGRFGEKLVYRVDWRLLVEERILKVAILTFFYFFLKGGAIFVRVFCCHCFWGFSTALSNG